MIGSRWMFLALPLVVACGMEGGEAGAGDAAAGGADAASSGAGWRATLRDSAGREVGEVTLRPHAHGMEVSVRLTGLPAGRHGFHVHQVGECTPPDFASAGGHFAPDGRRHGLESPEGPHAGDLPNVAVGEDGSGSLTIVNPYLSATDGTFPGAQGAAVVIHAGPDDYRTDPAGDSGARIACGVLERA